MELGGCRAKPGVELENEHQAKNKESGQIAVAFEKGVGPYAEEGSGRFVARDEKNDRHPLSVLEGGATASELILRNEKGGHDNKRQVVFEEMTPTPAIECCDTKDDGAGDFARI